MTDLTESPLAISHPQLTGRWLRAGQTTWLLMFLVCLFLMLAGAYSWYDNQRRSDCNDPAHSDWIKEACEPYYQALVDLRLAPEVYGAYTALLYCLAGLPFFGLSFVVARRRPDSAPTLFFAMFLAAVGAMGKWMNPLPNWAVLIATGTSIDLTWLSRFVTFYLLGLGPVVICTFPDGRFVPRWTRWPILLGWVPLTFVEIFFIDSPLNYWNLPTPWPHVLRLGLMGLVFYAAFHRYRRDADSVQRQQVKWFLVGLALLFANYLADYFVWEIYPLLTGSILIAIGRPAVLWELIQGTLWGVSESLFAVCVAFSVFRYRLFEIDLIIRRTVVWAVISGLGLTIYLLAVGATSFLLGSQPDYVVPLLALILVAFIARPLYRGLDAMVERVWPSNSNQETLS